MPFSNLTVTLRAFTYWGTSQQIKVKLLTPSSVPTKPLNLRAFVTHNRNNNNNYYYHYKKNERNVANVTVLLRWDKPLNSNGVLKGYKIDCWLTNDYDKINYCNYVTNRREKQFELSFNKTYTFKVN